MRIVYFAFDVKTGFCNTPLEQHEKRFRTQQQLIEELKQKQRKPVWPDTLLNGRNVDEYLWKGSPVGPLVQRIGAWISGLHSCFST